MWDEWRVSLEIMIMHSRSRSEACLCEVVMVVWDGGLSACVFWRVAFHLCVSPAGGKSNKNGWRHFGYWLKALCSARHSHLLGIPWRAGRTRQCIHGVLRVWHEPVLINGYKSVSFENLNMSLCPNYIFLSAFHYTSSFPNQINTSFFDIILLNQWLACLYQFSVHAFLFK